MLGDFLYESHHNTILLAYSKARSSNFNKLYIMYILSKVTVVKPFIDIQPIKIDRNALIFFYKQPPYKQLALEASKR